MPKRGSVSDWSTVKGNWHGARSKSSGREGKHPAPCPVAGDTAVHGYGRKYVNLRLILLATLQLP
jgi:hypothetical protein